MKRFLATILAISLLLTSGIFSAIAFAEEPYTVTMVMTGEQQEDQDRIMAKINEILLRDLNMQLDLIILPWGSADEQKRLMLTGSEPVDLMLISQTEAISCIANGQLNDMNELIDKYGTNYKEIIGEANAKAAAIGDFVYGACRIREVGQIPCVGMRKDLVEKYNIDLGSIKTIEDMEPIYAMIKENEPSITPLFVSSDQPPAERLCIVDSMGDDLAILPGQGVDTTEIIPIVECTEYAEKLRLLHKWYELGYINQDSATSTVSFESAFRAGDNFSAIMIWHPVSPHSFGGYEIVYAMLGEHIATSGSHGNTWSIPINSEDPEKAMQMLDYLYANKEVVQLLNWGEEGIDWVYVDEANNIINYPEGVTAETARYHAQYAYNLPNQYASSIWEGVYDPDVYENLLAFNKTGIHSNAFGFTFDPSGFETELAALLNVKAKYKVSLDTGAVDPDVYIPEFAAELEKNGIRELIAAKQEQFNKWLESK